MIGKGKGREWKREREMVGEGGTLADLYSRARGGGLYSREKGREATIHIPCIYKL